MNERIFPRNFECYCGFKTAMWNLWLGHLSDCQTARNAQNEYIQNKVTNAQGVSTHD